MPAFNNQEASRVLDRMIEAIQENKHYLSDIDGAIGDGDHGINMNKGFVMTREAIEKARAEGAAPDFSGGLLILAKVLMMRIGGSMGPLYGKTFKTLGKTFEGVEDIDATLFAEALDGARSSMQALSPAKVGDKTLVDALYPAIEAFEQTLEDGADFSTCLGAMKRAAEQGRDATRDMVAKLGRSSRLGERSVGVLDAGAASCALLLGVMADEIQKLIP